MSHTSVYFNNAPDNITEEQRIIEDILIEQI